VSLDPRVDLRPTNMAYNDLKKGSSKGIQRFRDTATNKSLAEVVADMNRAIDGDPPEDNTYNIVRHVAALISINNQIDIIAVSNLHATSWE